MTNQPALELNRSHQNNGLFSDYYLNERVGVQFRNNLDLLNEAQAVFKKMKTMRERIHPETLDEAQLETEWIQPVLHLLGHSFKVQIKIRYRDQGNRRPDYLFVKSEEEAHALTSDIYEPDKISHALAVGDAKKWGVKLDQSAAGQRNPSQQIDEYLRYSELDWGILTDGNIWRLYHRESSKYNSYYAISLDDLLGDLGSEESFLYFYAFFQQAAFTSGWLEEVRSGSEDFAQKLTDKLEDEVYEALEMIAQGFLDYRRNRLKPTPETLHEIYQQSLVLLYRLLFIFYAESREILPIKENKEYTERRSLSAIKRRVAQIMDNRRALNPDTNDIYNDLDYLFFAIDSGDASLDMPPYNGRLFLPDDHRFLADHVVGDAYMIPALDKLARVDMTEGRQTRRVFVDYRDLEVRHLGSIYEKLLEYELDIAHQPLTTKGSNQAYTPAQEGDAIVKNKGEVFLRTGSNERKVTGSYYTPDYIVRFIVEKTLEPLLTDITSRYATQDEDGQWHVDNPDALIAEILKINVLDPATGSGHFVVDATAYIAEWLRELGLRTEDMGNEDELIYWKRLVASACIYAVDINPLAVELAKLSMWLTTLAKGKPLSFLDHHIRVGNSLIGTSISQIDYLNNTDVKDEERRRKALERQQKKAAAIGQVSMFSDEDFTTGVRFAVEQMNAIESTVADQVEDVKRQEEMYAALRERLSVWQRAADVWTARYFGLELQDVFGEVFAKKEWDAIFTEPKDENLPPYVRAKVKEARQHADQHRFFHWELAFPEIFFDTNGQPLDNSGFDAVIGNPPYVRQERISPIKTFLQTHYDVYSGTADLFLYFYELGLEFLKEDHLLGYITSGTYMNSNSAKAFRQYIHDNSSMEWVVNFGENQPFRGAEMVYPTIAVMRHGEPRETFHNLFIEGSIPYAELQNTVEKGTWVDSLSEGTGMDEWRFQPVELTILFNKLVMDKQTLSEFVGGQLYSGIKTGLNDAFVVDETTFQELIKEDSSNGEVLRPTLRGQDLRPWYHHQSGNYLILSKQGIDISTYPAIERHLKRYKAKLENRTDSFEKWFELRPCDYYEKFDDEKIIWSDISKLDFAHLSEKRNRLD